MTNVKKPRRITIHGLTFEQEAYCRGRAMGMSVDDAVRASGSSVDSSTARRWERRPEVAARIVELSDMAQKNAILKTGLDREWVISRYMQIVDRCMQVEQMEGGEYRFDSSGANTALRALGDILGLFRPVEKRPEDDFAHLTDDDIARIATELAAQTGLLDVDPGIEAPSGQQQVITVPALPEAG